MKCMTVIHVAEELRDRFGMAPEVLENLFQIMTLKLLLKKAGIQRMSAEKKQVVLTFAPGKGVDPQRLVDVVARGSGKILFTPDQKLKLLGDGKGWPGMIQQTKKLLLEII